MRHACKPLLPAGTAGLVVLVDQAFKAGVAGWMADSLSLPLVGAGLRVAASLNPGTAGGLLAGSAPLLGMAALLGAGGLLVLGSFPAGRNWRLAMGLVAGGALANGLDRLRLGGVVDWLVLGGRLAFNLADLAVVAGAVLGVAAAWQSRQERVKGAS